jgi:tetratricopeptide (TPR) repeat protein
VTTRERKVAQKVGLARDLGVLEPEQAMALLEQWAGEMGEDEKAVAGELARRLGYLPLALALAGAQAQEGETWDDLLGAFRDMQEADVTVLDLDDPMMRDESLKLAFDLSVDRLGDAMAEQFAMLGVFAAGREAPFTAEAAAAVWEVKPIQAKKTLGRLARAALLDRGDDGYSLHLVVGDYARGRLDQAIRQSAEAGHSAYYLGVAQRSEQEWQVAEAALPQMRAAWGRVSQNDADGLCAWTIATYQFFRMRGRRDDERAALEMLEASSAASEAPLPDVAYLWAEYHEAVGEYAQAQAAAERALAAARGRADAAGEAACLAQLGLIARRQGEYDKAKDWYNQALELLRGEEAYPDEKARVLNGLGGVYSQQGQFDQAKARYEQCLALSRRSGNRRAGAQVLNSLGVTAFYQRDFAGALAYHRQALEIRRAIGDRAEEGDSLFNLAVAALDMGDYGQAQGYFAEALDIQQTTRNRWEEINIWNGLGGMYQQLGDLLKAQACLQRGLILAEEIGDEEGQAYLLSNLGLVVRDQGDLQTAEKLLSDGLAVMQALDNKHQVSFFLSYLGTVGLQAGDYEQAIERAQAALSLRQELDLRLQMADDLATLAAAYLAPGNVAQALVYAGQALAILDGCGGQGPEFSQQDYFICYQVLAGAGQEERAQAALQSAYNLVMARAEKITDPALRQSFLERVPVNREIVQEYGKRET